MCSLAAGRWEGGVSGVGGGTAERFGIRKDVYILHRGNEQGVEIIAPVHNGKWFNIRMDDVKPSTCSELRLLAGLCRL